MAARLDSEILGDWNNLKGTYYHLVYALWLLLRDRAPQVAFYRGNDLLANPILPPVIDSAEEATTIVPLRAGCADKDIWIQLKSTSEAWTPSRLLEDNLLGNFVCNAICSQRNNRLWETRLVTQAAVSQRDVSEFLANPSSKPRLANRLEDIVKAVEVRLQESAILPIPDNSTIRNLALSTLRQLSEAQPVALETLKAEVELELAYCYPNRRSVTRRADTLLGAMLKDGAGGPAKARVYDWQWLNETAGPGIKSVKPFDVDIVQACDQATKHRLPLGWEPNRYMPRKHLETLLRRFVDAEESVFVLLGRTGTGPAWPLAHFMATNLAERVRFLIRGSELDLTDSLDSLAATAFADLTSRDLREQDYLSQLAAAATAAGRPLVIGVYDIRVSPNEADRTRKTLGRLAEQARSLGAKLILACHDSTWQLYRLGTEIRRQIVFRPQSPDGSANGDVGLGEYDREAVSGNITAQSPTQDHSYNLADLTGDELNEVIRLRVPVNRLSAAQSQIRSLDQIALRNPYLLDHYLTRYGLELGLPDWAPVPANVDVLLDGRIEEQIERVAGALAVDLNSVRSAFWELASLLWDQRATGVSAQDVTHDLEKQFPSEGGHALRAFRQVGILTSSGRVVFSEEPLANHVFAHHLTARIADRENVWPELRPETDSDVVTAVVQMRPDPVLCAGTFVRLDPRWTKAVSHGLAACSPTDPRIIAALMGLAKPEGDAFVNADACRALGRLAARGPLAWTWATELYISGDSCEQVHAQYIMHAAMEWCPDAVCQLVEKRIRLERLRAGGSFHRRDDLRKRISDALWPLQGIAHREAARAASAVLEKCNQLIPQIADEETEFPSRIFADGLMDAIDDIRGGVALHNDPAGVTELLTELRSSWVITRYRAAGALRLASFERPEQIQRAVCDAIRSEQSNHVLHRLLWMSSRVQQIASNDFIDALASSAVARWDNPLVAAPALEVLGRAAHTHASKVRSILPERLNAMSADQRAFVSEAHLYAWWNLAEQDQSMEPTLALLGEPNVDGVSDEIRTFGLRTAALAQLATMSLHRMPTNEIDVRQFLMRHGSMPYMMLDTMNAVEKCATKVVSDPAFAGLLTAIVACVCEDNCHPVDVLSRDLRNTRFFVVRDCLDILIRLLAVVADPVPVLERLPHDWQRLYASTNLLSRKRQEETIVAFARQECADRPGWTAQAAHERERCLLELDRIAGLPSASLVANLTSARKSPISSMFGGEGETRRRADLADRAPDRLLAIVDELVTRPGDPSTLYDWHGAAKSWQSVLVARTYWRMFRPQKLGRLEATQLVDGMLTAIRSLELSEHREEYEAIYGALQDFFSGRVLRQINVRAPAGLIRHSHTLAATILQRSIDAPREQAAGRQWLSQFLLDRAGWWETTSCVLKSDGLSRGGGLYLIYFFPAVRLALAAIGNRFGIADPAGKFMIQRMSAAKAIKDRDWIWRGSPPQERLERGLSQLENLANTMPHDERLWHCCGNLLLRLGQLAEAEDRLKRCLNLPSCDSEMRARAKYDLACVYARQGDEERCRAAILEADHVHPLDRSWLAQDTDFQFMRDRPWFQQILVGTETG